MSDIDYKKEVLNKFGISVLDGNSYNIFLKYKDKKIPYNTQSYIMYNINYLITDICNLFKIENMEGDLILYLEKKKEYLKKLHINKIWLNNEFYLEKDNIMLKYNFDNYIEMEPELFIADVKTKFNRLKVNNTFGDEIRKSPLIISDNFKDMKLNIKNLLIERGFLNHA